MKLVLEGIKDVLKPRADKDIEKAILNLSDSKEMLKRSIESEFTDGIHKAIANGAEMSPLVLLNAVTKGKVNSIKELIKYPAEYENVYILPSSHVSRLIRAIKNGRKKEVTLEQLEEIKIMFNNAKIK